LLLAICTGLLVALIAIVLVPTALLALQVLASLLPRAKAQLPSGPRPAIAVLVPAHNESIGIRRTIEALRAELQPGDRLLVVADNCSDDTATVAAQAGAEVIQRHDTTQRGKGYALDFGVRHLAQAPPQVVVIVDADCLAYPGAIDRVARTCAERDRPVQALYLMSAPPTAGPMAPIAEFAWIVKNLVRPLGYVRLGLPCQLMGTGMAFPWSDIRTLPLASGHIVEDLKMGMELAAAGRAPLFCPDALVTSTFPASTEGTKSQRTRWEHGHLGMIFSDAPRYLARALGGANGGLLALTLDMCVPPLALLTLAVVATFGLALGHYALWSQPWVLAAAGCALALLALSVLLAWARFGRGVLSFGRLAYAPVYALRKIPLYARFLVRRQVDWVRSKRDVG